LFVFYEDVSTRREEPCFFFYDEGSGAKHKRIDPSEATSYLTTNGKSFSR
jgi:hypothetical protein